MLEAKSSGTLAFSGCNQQAEHLSQQPTPLRNLSPSEPTRIEAPQPQVSSLQKVAPLFHKPAAPTPAAQKQVASTNISSSSSSSNSPILFPPQAIASSIPGIAFGKSKWEKYFGDIGVELPLSANIEQILNSSCPFWPDKKVSETHLLVLIPETVNGKSFHLDSLSELIKSPKRGYRTEYRHYSDNVKKELGAKRLGSYWILMTKDVIPDSRGKSYEEQKALVQKHAQTSKIPYELPMALEAATAILVHYIETKEVLYTNNKLGTFWTYTRCQEKVSDNSWPTAIGGFSFEGLSIYGHRWSDDYFFGSRGIGCCRHV